MFLSIIAPYYECGPYIYTCLKSIDSCIDKLKHTSIDIEVLVVDDFNHDENGALSLLNGAIYALNNTGCFRVIRPEKNLGLAEARNFGISEAKGEYLFFLDSDDYINSKNLAEVLTILNSIRTDIIYFDSHSFKNEHTWNQMWQYSFHPRSIQPVDDNIVATYLHDTTFYAWRFIVKSEIMQKVKFKSMYMEDVATTPTILAACKNLWYEPISVVNYRIRPNSIMTAWNPKKITDMLLAPSITQSNLSPIAENSPSLKNESKILGYRFFFWAIKDARAQNPEMDKDFYLKIKNLYIENFGELNLKEDLPLLRKLYKPDELAKWLLLYNSWFLFSKSVTKGGNFKYKALRKKIWGKITSFTKAVMPIAIILLIAFNIYHVL